MAGGQVEEPFWVDFASVILLHDYAIAEFGGLGGVPNPHYLESAIEAPRNALLYSDGGMDLYDLAAVYLYHIAKAHAFTDGNKRAAYMTALVFLHVNGIQVFTAKNALMLAQAVEQAARAQDLQKDKLAGVMRTMPAIRSEPGDFF